MSPATLTHRTFGRKSAVAFVLSDAPEVGLRTSPELFRLDVER